MKIVVVFFIAICIIEQLKDVASDTQINSKTTLNPVSVAKMHGREAVFKKCKVDDNKYEEYLQLDDKSKEERKSCIKKEFDKKPELRLSEEDTPNINEIVEKCITANLKRMFFDPKETNDFLNCLYKSLPEIEGEQEEVKKELTKLPTMMGRTMKYAFNQCNVTFDIKSVENPSLSDKICIALKLNDISSALNELSSL